MSRSILPAAVLLTAAALVLTGPVGTARAHEERTVGRFHLAVGFGGEPAYAGQENSVQMFLHDASGRPVTDLGPTLVVRVTYQAQTGPQMAMEPNFEVGESGIPGDYRAFFFPTRPGTYSFHLSGTIKGQPVDATFTSGPKTFSDVEDPASAEFPARDPTTGQLAQRLEREIPRLGAAISAQARAARSDTRGVRTLAVIAVALGVLGLALGGTGLALGIRLRGSRRSGQGAGVGREA